MPSRETTVTGATRERTAVERVQRSIADFRGRSEPAEPTDDGVYIVRATFAHRDDADAFHDMLRQQGFSSLKRLTRNAVLSWVGHYGYVSVADTTYGGSTGRSGTIQLIDGKSDAIRIVPRIILGGLDLGPVPNPESPGNEAPIENILDIEEGRPM